MSYKYCCVPMCESTTKSTPDKLFLKVPMDPIRRKKWFSLMRRKHSLAPSTNCYACEDHFDVEEVVENIIKVRLVGGPLVLKKEAVPTKFNCQTKRILAHSPQPSPLGVKRMRQSPISDVTQPNILNDENIENTGLNASEHLLEIPTCSSKVDAETQVSWTSETHKNVYIRSKAIKTKACLKDRASSPILMVKNMQTSPIKIPKLLGSDIYSDDSSDSNNISSYVDDRNDKDFSTLFLSEPSDCDEESISALQSFKHTQKKIIKKPLLYIGVLPGLTFLVSKISMSIKASERDVLLCLKKIRQNEQFEVLGDDFGITASHAGSIFRNNIPKIASYLKKFIIWPDRESISLNLPIPFRTRYHKVVCIIDCLEIQIEKPSNDLHQSLTWSAYKNVNTIKYLIACTPDGTCSFISEGFGGKASDCVILKESTFLNYLRNGMEIMADRGFKHVENILIQRGCSLVRPPSVSSTETLNKKDAMLTTQIAALRIPVERVIGRLRHFLLLGPHACVDNKLVTYIDEVIIIACALINLQSKFIQ